MKFFHIACLLSLLLLLPRLASGQPAQRIKLTQLEQGKNIGGSRKGQVGITDTAGNQRYYFMINVADTCLNFTPSPTGNSTVAIVGQRCGTDSIWMIDYEGRAILLAPYDTSGGSNDRDWLTISSNTVPYSINDSIYTYKYASVGARLVWPGAEFLVNDSIGVALQVLQGNRNSRLAFYDKLNQTFSFFDGGGSTLYGAFPPGGSFLLRTVTGTPENPLGATTHFSVSDQDSTIQFNQYGSSRAYDTGSPRGFLWPDNAGKIRFSPLDSVGGGNFIEVDSAIQIMSLSPSINALIFNKQNQSTYVVRQGPVSGFVADTNAVVRTTNGRYAIVRPVNGAYNLEWFGVSRLQRKYQRQIKNALQFIGLDSTANKLIWPAYTVLFSMGNVNNPGAGFFVLPQNLTIEGTSGKSVWKLANQDTIYEAWFFPTGIDNFTMIGMTLDGNKNNTVSQDEQTHFFNMSGGNQDNWFIENCQFINCRRDAFKMLNSKNIRIENCQFNDNQRGQLVVQRGCENIWILNNWFENGGDGHVDFEPTAGDTIRNVFIENNYFGKYAQGSYACALSSAGSSNPNINVHFRNNLVEKGGISALGNIQGMYIENNIFSNRYLSGTETYFDIRQNIDGLYIRGNEFRLTDSFRTANAVIRAVNQLGEPNFVEVSNNRFVITKDSLTENIITIADCNYVIVKDNTIDSDSAIYTTSRIVVNSENDVNRQKNSWVITGNYLGGSVVNNSTAAITCGFRGDTIQSVRVTGNHIKVRSGQGSLIRLTGNVGSIVRDAIVSENTTSGVANTFRMVSSSFPYKTGQNSWSGSGVPSFTAGVRIGDLYQRSDTSTATLYQYTSTGWVVSGQTFWSSGTSAGQIFYSGGNVGIGTNNPTQPLYVNGSSILVDRTAIGLTAINSTAQLAISTSSPSYRALRVDHTRGADATGNVLEIYGVSAYGSTNNPNLLSMGLGTTELFGFKRNGEVNFWGTSYLKLHTGTTSQRPATAGLWEGGIRFNDQTNRFEGSDSIAVNSFAYTSDIVPQNLTLTGTINNLSLSTVGGSGINITQDSFAGVTVRNSPSGTLAISITPGTLHGDMLMWDTTGIDSWKRVQVLKSGQGNTNLTTSGIITITHDLGTTPTNAMAQCNGTVYQAIFTGFATSTTANFYVYNWSTGTTPPDGTNVGSVTWTVFR